MKRFSTYCLLLCCLSGLALYAPRARATTYTITNLTDSPTVDGCTSADITNGCTLREAITDANADATTTDTIPFAPELAGGTLTLATALPDITTSLSILNPATQNITLARSTAQSTPNFNILVVYASGNDDNFSTAPTGPSVALRGLTLKGGASTGSSNQFRDSGGGGLYVENSTVALTGCTLSGNTGSYLGGGLLNYGGAVTCTNSTIAGNGANNSGYGGGVFNYRGTLALINSTLAGNAAAIGGGLHTDSSTVTLTNCTVTGNTANNQGSGIEFFGSGTVTLSNNIVAGNANSDLDAPNGGVYSSSGYNLIGSSVTGASSPFTQPGDRVNVNPADLKLGPLQDNGGPTQTRAIGRESAAFNAGSTTLTTDQRGVSRPVGSADDVGAYEFTGTQSLIVTTLTDEDDGTSDPSFGAGTSLREALVYANSNADQSNITFAPGLAGGTLTLATALPDIATSLSISNPAAQTIILARSTVAGTPDFALLSVSNSIKVDVSGGSGRVPTGPTVNFRGITLTNGHSDPNGAELGFRNLAGGGLFVFNSTVGLTNCTLTNNVGYYYGGGLNNYGGAVTLTNCSVTNNTALMFGGGILSGSGTLTLINSTVANNTLTGQASAGGGIENESSLLRLTNTTIANNTATAVGGGIRNYTGRMIMSSCTVTGNTAPENGGSGISTQSATTTLSNSIVAGNTHSDLDVAGGGSAPYSSGGYNLLGTSGTNALSVFNQPGDKTGVTTAQLKLGALQNNGGPTQTIAIGTDSLAYNAGDPTVQASGTAYDQRGNPYRRVSGGRLDVGAYEAQVQNVTVSGRVYNAVALAGLPGIVVKAERQSDGMVFAVGTDSNGNYSLSLVPGTYTFSAFLPRKPGFIINPAFSNPVTLTGSPTTLPNYNFRAVGVTGRVISPSNVGISGVTLNLYAQTDTALKSPLRTAKSDSNGFFSLDGVAPGTYLVAPVAPTTYTYTPATRTVTVVDKAVFTSFKASAKPSTAPRSVAGARSSVTLSSTSTNALAGTLTFKFTGALDAASAADLSHYGVQVDGEWVSVTGATLSQGGDTLILTLPQSTLRVGSQVLIGWSGVLDGQGLPLQGTVEIAIF